MVRTLVLSIAALALLAPACADECANADTQTQMTECAGKAFAAADKALNAAYKGVMDRLGGEQQGRKLLVGAQKYWLAFRDAECAFETSASAGGSIHPMEVAGCRMALIQARTQRLRQILDCKEGDTCPLPPK